MTLILQKVILTLLWIGQKSSLPKICRACPAMMILGTVMPYLKYIQKYVNDMMRLLSSLMSAFFHQKSATFFISRNTHTGCILIIISNSFNLFWAFKFCFNTILMMLGKLVTLGLLKIKVFWNKGYHVIILSMTSPAKFYPVTEIIL